MAGLKILPLQGESTEKKCKTGSCPPPDKKKKTPMPTRPQEYFLAAPTDRSTGA